MKKLPLKILLICLFIIFIILVFFISRSLIKPIIFSLVLAYLLNPLVKLLTSKGINKKISIAISLVLFLGIAFVFTIYIIPGIIKDLLGIIGNINDYDNIVRKYISKIGYDNLPEYLKEVINDNLSKFQVSMTEYLNKFFKEIINFSMELPTYVLAPVFVYYFLADTDYFLSIVKTFIPARARNKATELGREINKVIGSFIMSQIILSAVIAVITFIALLVLKVRFPVLIALINGITNIIPYFGPVIGFVPAFFLALSESLDKAVIVSIVFIIIQQFESDIIAPKLMSDSIGIHPVFVIIILLLGGKYFGAWGLILSIPVAGIIKVTYKYIARNLY